MTALSAQQIAGAASAAGFSGSNLTIAVAVALAESGGNPNAINNNTNGSTDYGLWQINTVHGSLLNQGNKFDPTDNAKMAYVVWKGSGWSAWTTYNTGAYRAFMGKAALASGSPTVPPSGGQAVSTTPTGIVGGTQNIISFFNLVGSPQLWANIGKLVLGCAFLVAGTLLLVKNSASVKQVVTIGKKAAEAAAL